MQFYPNGNMSYIIQYGDTLWVVAKRFNTTIDAIILANPGIVPENLYVGQRIVLPIGSGVYNANSYKINNDIFNLSNLLRLLWEQQVTWLRAFMLSNIYDIPDLEHTKVRLFENPNHFASALMPYYGNQKALEFQKLLTGHIQIYVELINTVKAKGQTNELETEWEINADEIAQFLSSLNPHWLEVDWQRMLHKYIRLIKDEITYYLGKDYHNGVLMFDEIQRQALDLADMMTNGIIKQFPKQFYNLRKKK